MSVTPSDFLKSAANMNTVGCDEMAKRNVISRLYYAAYHRSCEFIKPAYCQSSMHRSYIDQLNKGGHLERQISGSLKRMHARRIIADYRLNEDLKKDSVTLQSLAANELFTKLLN